MIYRSRCASIPTCRRSPSARRGAQIDGILVFDCETRTDPAQALTFGSYRFVVEGRCLQEGLFYGDDLTPRRWRPWNATSRARADTDPRGLPEHDIPSDPELQLLPVAEFRKLLYASRTRAARLLVAFNFPFDISAASR